jgi:ribosomal protein S12 methylthiotransferase accessory factor
MTAEIHVSFPGGKRVDAEVGGHLIRTDQRREAGGAETAPEPFTLFAASIGTCAGLYALGFCRARELPTEGLSLRESLVFDENTHTLTAVDIDVHLPRGFPERYRDALVRAVEGCAVKKAIQARPEFRVRTSATA